MPDTKSADLVYGWWKFGDVLSLVRVPPEGAEIAIFGDESSCTPTGGSVAVLS